MPLGADVGANIRHLKEKNKGKKKKRSRKQIIAIALDAARKAGGKVSPKKGRK